MTEPLASLLDAAPRVVEGMGPVGLSYLMATADTEQPWVVVVPDERNVERLAEDLAGWGMGDVTIFPADPHVPFEEVSPDIRLAWQRLHVRHRLLAGERPAVLVVSAVALLGRWMPRATFAGNTEIWIPGEAVGRDRLSAHFVRCGFQPVSLVEDEGTFALRGGIVDVFPPGWSSPVRIDLFGDEIASLKRFDPETQRTGRALEYLAIHPIREVVFDEQSVASALARLEQIGETQNVPTRRLRALMAEVEQHHYFFGVESLWPAFHPDGEPIWPELLADSARVVAMERDRIEPSWSELLARAEHERTRGEERHRPMLEVAEHFSGAAEVRGALQQRARLSTVTLALESAENRLRPALSDFADLARELEVRRTDSSRGEILDPLVTQLKRLFEQRYEVFLACTTRGNAERVAELLRARGLDLPINASLPDPLTLGVPRRSPRRAVVVASLSSGLCDGAHRVAVLTEREIFGTAPKRRARRHRPSREGLATLRDLSEGDLVIHVDHGVGRYQGLSRLVLGGVDGDYVQLEYAGSDRLYVPIYRLSQLQQYRGPSAGVRLDKLGGTRWEKTKRRVKDAVLALAHELLAVQARRRLVPALALPAPNDQFRAFEATFPYEETPDQKTAIDAVVADLQRDTPMDRLVCGDVGFGKTEVAVRAAFLTVLGGRQVAVLVPTTVLAEQHGMTFRERLQGVPITVEVLSRFRSPKATRALIERIRSGRVDVVIGTHRMLSADVSFRALGLLVVDEEQRFGVRQKERIKQLRHQVHVLTLSATPIPRTMHMAVTGLRDLSIIQTPPVDRTAIRTEVTLFDEEVVATAIRRELHRGGQVFVVHNRVRSIDAMARVVQRLVPEARVQIAHGQMAADRLERIMVEFVRREHNVLVCTAIIESGLDIPSANTMVVNRADMFGLSQLYQLRGRIGRGRERGYAYLLLPRSERVGRQAMERLAVLKRFSELGAGFQIASHDLELRGAGDLLGANQSGHVAAVGFELYTELLGEAVEQARGQIGRTEVEPELKLPVVAVLPESYVPEPMHRLSFYQRMAQSDSDEAIFDVLAEIQERYGPAPKEARHLADVMVIRRRLRGIGAMSLSVAAEDDGVRMGLTFVAQPPLDHQQMTRLLQERPEQYRLLPSGRFSITVGPPTPPGPDGLLRLVRDQVGSLPRAAEEPTTRKDPGFTSAK